MRRLVAAGFELGDEELPDPGGEAIAVDRALGQAGRRHVAIHARQLALKPALGLLRHHRRPMRLRLSNLANQPWRIISTIGQRNWAHGS
jgi:hypothetical protein